MKFELTNMYKYLLSHTFPGLLLGIEILFSIHWFVTKPDIWSVLNNKWTGAPGDIVVLLIIAYAFATLLGFIIDGVHHFFFEDIWGWFGIKETYTEADKKKFLAIRNLNDMQIYQYFLDEDYWYAYEAYANIAIAMLPGLFLLVYWLLYRLKVSWLSTSFLIPTALYTIVLAIVIIEAVLTHKVFEKDHNAFIEAFSNRP